MGNIMTAQNNISAYRAGETDGYRRGFEDGRAKGREEQSERIKRIILKADSLDGLIGALGFALGGAK